MPRTTCASSGASWAAMRGGYVELDGALAQGGSRWKASPRSKIILATTYIGSPNEVAERMIEQAEALRPTQPELLHGHGAGLSGKRVMRSIERLAGEVLPQVAAHFGGLDRNRLPGWREVASAARIAREGAPKGVAERRARFAERPAGRIIASRPQAGPATRLRGAEDYTSFGGLPPGRWAGARSHALVVTFQAGGSGQTGRPGRPCQPVSNPQVGIDARCSAPPMR